MSARKFIPSPDNAVDPATLALGGIIREERLRRGWSPTQLAGICGIRRQTIEAIEKGMNRPRVDTAEHIAHAFGMSGGELLLRADRRVAR